MCAPHICAAGMSSNLETLMLSLGENIDSMGSPLCNCFRGVILVLQGVTTSACCLPTGSSLVLLFY
jgi:hypothetical protein